MPERSKLDLELFRTYASARKKFLREIGIEDSCRDPLAEFAEWIVQREYGGQPADSRVQKGYDLVLDSGERVQVKYLSNPDGTWRNEHHIVFTDDMDKYAIVFFENFEIVSLICFPKNTLNEICSKLKKRHPNQDQSLQLTKRNYEQIIAESDSFALLGVQCKTYPIRR